MKDTGSVMCCLCQTKKYAVLKFCFQEILLSYLSPYYYIPPCIKKINGGFTATSVQTYLRVTEMVFCSMTEFCVKERKS